MLSSELEGLSQKARRFPELLEVSEAAHQLENRAKVLQRNPFPPFNPRDEQEFENWTDAVSRIVWRAKLPLQLFLEAWEGAATEQLALVIGDVTATSYEGYVDEIAKVLFPISSYVEELEEQLFRGQRQLTVLDAHQWMVRIGARFFRIRKRRQYSSIVGDAQIRIALLACLSFNVEKAVRHWDLIHSVAEILRRALKGYESF